MYNTVHQMNLYAKYKPASQVFHITLGPLALDQVIIFWSSLFAGLYFVYRPLNHACCYNTGHGPFSHLYDCAVENQDFEDMVHNY